MGALKAVQDSLRKHNIDSVDESTVEYMVRSPLLHCNFENFKLENFFPQRALGHLHQMFKTQMSFSTSTSTSTDRHARTAKHDYFSILFIFGLLFFLILDLSAVKHCARPARRPIHHRQPFGIAFREPSSIPRGFRVHRRRSCNQYIECFHFYQPHAQQALILRKFFFSQLKSMTPLFRYLASCVTKSSTPSPPSWKRKRMAPPQTLPILPS
jgi:hypothetical protein